MSFHDATIQIQLPMWSLSAHKLSKYIGINQPTISRALTEIGDQVIRIGAARSIQYTLRNTIRELLDITINRFNANGQTRQSENADS